MIKPLSVLLCALFPGAILFACATDNGDVVHGPQFGPTPERPDGSTDGGPTSEEGGPTPNPEGGTDAADGAPPTTCTDGTVVVLAGGDATLSGAAQVKAGPWAGAAIAGGASASLPALVPFGTGFVGLTRGPGDLVQSVAYGTSWTGAAAVGSLTTRGTPALTVVGTKAHAVLLSGGADPNKFYRIENAASSWTTVTDPVTPPGGAQSFGPSAGAVAAAGAELVFAQDGDDDGLYTQRWNGTWATGAPVTGAGTLKSVPPALVAVDGKFDLVLLYADKTVNNVIGYATRDATTKAWSTATVTHGNAQTAEQMSVARISPFVIMVTYRGNNGRPYYMAGTLGVSNISWSTPAQLLADGATVESAPSVAKGVCGDDAIAVFATLTEVKATRYRGTAWTVPETVTGAAGKRVSVATR